MRSVMSRVGFESSLLRSWQVNRTGCGTVSKTDRSVMSRVGFESSACRWRREVAVEPRAAATRIVPSGMEFDSPLRRRV